ncbi:hypothetical protein DMX03_01595 [Pseudomonas koreensis]|nr:hypothetical protein DMX03_01595 [Pseudomonas koreensis]
MVDLQHFFEPNTYPVARGFIPVRLRSSRSPVHTVSLRNNAGRLWGRCVPQRGQVPSPREVAVPPGYGSRPRSRGFAPTSKTYFSAAREGRRFVLCLHLETL